jgi:general secretion pathway protein F
MPNFRYRALTASGAVITGMLEAPSEPAVIEELRNRGHYPIDATAGTAHPLRDWRGWFTRHIAPKRATTQRGLMIATQELSSLLGAGFELERALEVVVHLDETKPMRAIFARILERVRGGSTLSEALSDAAVFPKFYVSIVRAGEHGGDLRAALEQLGDYLARSLAVREAVVSALIYPMVLLATAGVSLIVVLVFVLPSFKPLFAEAGKALPPATQFVMDAGDFLTNWSWAVLLAVAGLVLALRRALKERSFRRRCDAALLRLPLFGPLIAKLDIERFGRTLGTLLRSGVELPPALVVTADSLSNAKIADTVRAAATGLKEGDMLARHLETSGVFPTLALDMIRVGEESAQLDRMLLRQADLYEREIKHTIDRLVALLVPCLTIFMGLIVAGLIGSILMAILSVNDLAM